MANCGSLLKSVLVAVVLMAVVQSGSAAEKLATCCKKVDITEITEPISGYLVQEANPPCVRAVIFQTSKGLFCSYLRAPWVRRKIVAFEKAKAEVAVSSVLPSSSVSLLSMITSTASPPSSSSFPSSSTPSSSSSFPSSSTPSSSSSFPSSSTPSSSSSFPSSSTPLSSSFPSSSTPLFSSSFPSTSETPADETFSGEEAVFSTSSQ